MRRSYLLLVLLLSTRLVADTHFKAKLVSSIDAPELDTGISSDSINFLQLTPFKGSSENLHYVIIEGLKATSTDSPEWLHSKTRTVDASTGDVVEKGSVSIKYTPSANDDSAVYSPIVGIIPRTGSWETNSAIYTDTDVSESIGKISFLNDGTLKIKLLINDTIADATTSWNKIDDDNLQISAFSLNVNGTTYSFKETTLVNNGNLFTASLERSDNDINFDNSTYGLVVEAYDSDYDGISDITDTETYRWYSPFWSYASSDNDNDITIGNLIKCDWLGLIYLPNDGSQWMTHSIHGLWWPVPLEDQDAVWLYDFALGWLFTSKAFNTNGEGTPDPSIQMFYQANTAQWIQFIREDNGGRIFWMHNDQDYAWFEASK